MKANQLFLLLWLFVFGCKTVSRPDNEGYSKNLKSAFVDGFKTLSLCRCLEYAHERELELWDEDVDCRTPDYLYAQSKIIDSLVRIEAEKIQQAEATRNYPRAEGMEGKKITSSCLAFYNSKALDKIVKQRLKADIKSFNSIGQQL
ncbi:hypothetical protein H8S95_16415 [Pontibacter sp. KCTC 32443]|uniref:hypothetical protein n=1 Tax=Pontibacter TaxID=323449 RepID=UPI00164CE93D|nr:MULTISPECIES: hypothetical protein [Pontibacter]MBC5775663.1 hypothetical protein [Pontibacter sp. KCTC 32443]